MRPRSCGTWLRQAVLLIGLLTGLLVGLLVHGHAQATAAQPERASDGPVPRQAEVLQAFELPRQPIQGLRPVELSGLAWDPALQQLWAASDRGHLFVWQVDLRSPAQLLPLKAWRLRRPGPGPGSGSEDPRGAVEVNAETLSWQPAPASAAPEAAPAAQRPQGSLWLGGEHEAGPWQLDAQGGVVATPPWPGALQAARPQAEHGIEALSWHPVHGLLAARQRPVRKLPVALPAGTDVATRWHAVYGAGRAWWFAAAHPQSQLKAIETQGANGLLLLERVPLGQGVLPVLRWLDLQGCAEAQVCRPQTLAFQPALPPAADNYEGLACTAQGLCWLVSDATGKAGSPTRWLVLRLRP